MNAEAVAAIRRISALHYAAPINPPMGRRRKAISKLQRLVGLRSDFAFFSQDRLKAIAREVEARSTSGAQADFFHGFTPWILSNPRRPYVAWSDCTFRDYIDIYHRREHFRRRDIERIEQAEAAWLRNAESVLFTSRWAADRAVADYELDGSRVRVVGIFGEMNLPSRDVYAGGKQFGFVSTNFEAKGGPIVLAAFRQIRQDHADASLVVVGDRPRNSGLEPGVSYTGFLRKELPNEYDRLREILAGLRALVHPTRSDITPLLLVEAAYFGCPAISSRKFAIPEIVHHERTGLLLRDVSQPSQVASAMRWMLEQDDQYHHMRTAAWVQSREQHSKARFRERLASSLVGALPSVATQ